MDASCWLHKALSCQYAQNWKFREVRNECFTFEFKSSVYCTRSLQICFEEEIQYIVDPFEADTELLTVDGVLCLLRILTLLAYGCKKVPVS